MEKRRERGDLLAAYKGGSGMERFDKEDMFVRDLSTSRQHSKKQVKTRCLRDTEKYRFPSRCIDACNALDNEIVNGETVSRMKRCLTGRVMETDRTPPV